MIFAAQAWQDGYTTQLKSYPIHPACTSRVNCNYQAHLSVIEGALGKKLGQAAFGISDQSGVHTMVMTAAA